MKDQKSLVSTKNVSVVQKKVSKGLRHTVKSKIEIRKVTKDELKKYGVKDSTWDQIVVDLLNHACVCDIYWGEKTWSLL